MRAVHREKDFKGSRSEQARKGGISRKRCGDVEDEREEKRTQRGKKWKVKGEKKDSGKEGEKTRIKDHGFV